MLEKDASLAVGAPDEDAEPGVGAFETRHWQVASAQSGERLDRALATWLPEFSRSHAQWLIEQGAVTLDTQVTSRGSSSKRLRLGQRVSAELRLPDSAAAYLPEPLALDVVFEDEHLLVINKPAGLVVHPGAGNWRGTLLNGLLHRYADAAVPAASLPRAGIVHRLDKDTSGLMVVARSPIAVVALVSAISQRKVGREYLALAEGPVPVPAEVSGEWRLVDAAIGRDPANRVKMAVLPPTAPGAKPAQTRFQQLGEGSVGRAQAMPRTLLRCQLHTGRTHQIRVHLAHLGHPITGDSVYGKASTLIARQALHARRLNLEHPATQEPLTFDAPMPADMLAAVRACGVHYNAETWQ